MEERMEEIETEMKKSGNDFVKLTQLHEEKKGMCNKPERQQQSLQTDNPENNPSTSWGTVHTLGEAPLDRDRAQDGLSSEILTSNFYSPAL